MDRRGWCGSEFPCAQDPGIPVWFIWEVPDPVERYSPFSIPTGLWLIFAKFEVRSFLRSDVIVITTEGQTDRHSSNVSKESGVSDQYFYASHTY